MPILWDILGIMILFSLNVGFATNKSRDYVTWGIIFPDSSLVEERSRLNLNGSRQLSKSATELRNNDSSSPSRRGEQTDSGVVHHHRHHRHATSVAQRTHIFFATLKSRWSRNRSKERKKSKDAGTVLSQGVESDYAADYSSEHSKSSSATQSPARHYLNHPGTYLFIFNHSLTS